MIEICVVPNVFILEACSDGNKNTKTSVPNALLSLQTPWSLCSYAQARSNNFSCRLDDTLGAWHIIIIISTELANPEPNGHRAHT